MATPYGAPREAWATFTDVLDLTPDLLPVVSNPTATISPHSKMKALGKTPSIYNHQRQAVGIPQWTQHQATIDDVVRWVKEPDYGICLQTRRVRALDCDITDPDLVLSIYNMCVEFLGYLPVRGRADAAKILLAFVLEGEYTKRVLHTAHGAVEFLAAGQQFVASGTHTGGARYRWSQGGGAFSEAPSDIPTVAESDFESLWSALESSYGIRPSTTSKSSTKRITLEEAAANDPTAQALHSAGLVLSQESDGRLHITCPFASEHTTEGAESATTYWPAHTGGFEHGNFKCLHAHCEGRARRDYLDALGLTENPADDFDDLGDLDEDRVGSDEVADGAGAERDAGDAAGEEDVYLDFSPDDFLDGKPLSWLIKHVLPDADLGVVFGESQSGKSFIVFDMGAAISRGIPWRGNKTTKSRVYYVAAEGAQGYRNRLRAYCDHHDIAPSDVDMKFLPNQPNLFKVKDVKKLIRTIRLFKPRLVIVDTLAQTTAGTNENSGEDMGVVLSHCREIRKRTGAMVLLIHHSGKDASKGARGWSGLKAAADVEIVVERYERDRVASVTKLKDGEDGAEYGFNLDIVVVGEDEDGEAITSCVVKHTTSAVKRTRGLGKTQRIVLSAFSEIMDLSGGPVTWTELRDVVASKMPPPSDAKRDRRERHAGDALQGLIDSGHLLMKDGVITLEAA